MMASALLATTGLGMFAGIVPATAYAQEARRYDIPAGPLAVALNRFGEAADVAIVYDSALTIGASSPGLKGSFGTAEALSRLLVGTGLTYRQDGPRAFTLEKGSLTESASASQGSDNAIRLGPVRVEAVTEGTGSYTTGLTNTATKLDLSIRETPQSVTVVTRQRIEDQGLEEIRDVLDETVGLFFQQTGPVGSDSNFVYSRGFPMQNYQVDGIQRSTRFGFQNDISDMAVYDRVEVVRGASGLLNSIGEPSGSVNLVRKVPTADFQAYVSGKFGSWDHYRAEGDVSGPLTEGGHIRARLVGAYQDSDSFIDRLNLQKKVLYGIVEAYLGPTTILSVGVDYQHHKSTGATRFGVPIFLPDGTRSDFPRSASPAAKWGYHTRRNLTLFSSVDHYFDNGWRLELDVEHARRKYDSVMSGVDLSSWGISAQGNRWSGTPQQTSLRFHATGPYTLFGREHELLLGVSYDYFRAKSPNYNSGGEDISFDEALEIIRTGAVERFDVSPNGSGSKTTDRQSGAYVATRLHPADPVSILVGARLSNWKTRRDRFSAAGVVTKGVSTKESGVVTPYAGLVIDLTKYMSIYGSYTDIFQPASERDANGDLLSPAKGSNIEAGIKLSFFEERLNVTGSYYKTKKDGVPEYVPGPGGGVNYGPTGDYVYRTVDGTKTTGFEFEVAGQLTPRWQVSGGYSHSNPRDVNGDRRLIEVPTDTFKLFTSYRLGGAAEGLTLGGNLRIQNKIETTCEGYCPYFRQGGFAIVDLMADYKISQNVSVKVNINNVFDKTYFTDIYSSGWFGEPRSAFVTLRFGF